MNAIMTWLGILYRKSIPGPYLASDIVMPVEHVEIACLALVILSKSKQH